MKLQDHWHTQAIETSSRDTGVVPAYGVIEEIRVRPSSMTPNMDAAHPCRFEYALYGPDGQRVACSVTLIARSIEP